MAKWLEAHAPGEQSFQSVCLTVVESVSVEAWKSSVGEPARPGDVTPQCAVSAKTYGC